ncbi:MAG: FkbM family methyltransferase [Cyclobacteriaceae bacterium]
MRLIQDLFASLFRSLNSRLLYTDNPLLHKPLKLVYGLSAWCYRMKFGRKKSAGRVTLNNFDGSGRLIIDPKGSMGASLYWTGFHELHELLFLHKFLKPGMVVADAGANMGMFTVFAARRVKNGKVIAFEPVPSVFKRLQDNVMINDLKNVIALQTGLSNTTGVLPIYEIEGDNEGLSTLYPGSLQQSRVTEVEVKPLDLILEKQGIDRMDLIKMDIEGGELSALRGSIQTIRKFRPAILIEINISSYASAGYKPADVYDFFRNENYLPHRISKSGSLVRETNPSDFNNIVFLPL